MKATFAAREPNILMEAQPGDLFVPLGPRLVDCVCALRSHENYSGAVEVFAEPVKRLDPNAVLPVIVIACRVEKGEAEYHPPGFQTYLCGAAPISFLEQVEPLALRERSDKKPHLNVRVDTAELAAALDRRRKAVADAAVDRIVAAANADMQAIRYHDGGYVEPHRPKTWNEAHRDATEGVIREVPPSRP